MGAEPKAACCALQAPRLGASLALPVSSAEPPSRERHRVRPSIVGDGDGDERYGNGGLSIGSWH